MLVSRLYELFKENVPKRERAIFSGCPRGEGIWDIFGYYDYRSYLITICEPEVENHSKKLATQLKLDKTKTRLMLRELVRLHEHAHALLHTGKLEKIFEEVGLRRRRFKMGYPNFPLQINEPLTEFIAWSVICNVGSRIFEKVFNEVDKDAPPYYRAWAQLKELIDNKSKPAHKQYILFVPGLVQTARDGIWNDFQHFIQGIKDRYELLQDAYKILVAIEKIC